jgi:hypothetical protein
MCDISPGIRTTSVISGGSESLPGTGPARVLLPAQARSSQPSGNPMHYWSAKDLTDPTNKLVRFRDGRLFSILPDRTKQKPTYTLGDEFGMIEGAPKHQGPMSEAGLLATLNGEGAKPVSHGDAMRIRADHRVKVKNEKAAAGN